MFDDLFSPETTLTTIGTYVVIVGMAFTLFFYLALWLTPKNRKSGLTPLQQFSESAGIKTDSIVMASLMATAILAYGFIFTACLIITVTLLIGVAIGHDTAELPFRVAALLAAVLGAPFLIWRTVIAGRQNAIAEQGQITDRINAAVASLGAEKTVKRQRKNEKGVLLYENGKDGKPDYKKPITEEVTLPNMEVRTGAILALGRIARENLGFHVQIMQILCAYIRENSPAESAVPFEAPEFPAVAEGEWVTKEQIDAYKEELDQKLSDLREALPKPRTDIQTALDVIGRRNQAQKRKEGAWPDPDGDAPCPFDCTFGTPPAYPENYTADAHTKWDTAFETYNAALDAQTSAMRHTTCYRHDLRNTNLQGYDLTKLDLRGNRFDGAQMQRANLHSAQMQGAKLYRAQMQGAYLGNAQMQGANLPLAEMQGAKLPSAQMQRANLYSAQMQGADLGSAQMHGAGLFNAQMQRAYLSSAQMQRANLSSAQMQRAYLGSAQMQGADLDSAQMQGARLFRAQMQGADLDSAQMQGAYLRSAQMQGAYFGSAQMQGASYVTAATLRGAAVTYLQCTSITELKPHWDVIFGDGSLRDEFPHGETWPDHWLEEELEWDDFIAAWRAWAATLDPPVTIAGD